MILHRAHTERCAPVDLLEVLGFVAAPSGESVKVAEGV